MTPGYYMGVDPGGSGSICVVNMSAFPVLHMPLKNATDHDIKEMLEMVKGNGHPIYCAFEKVHAMPKQGVSSTFKFGQSFGALIAHITWAGAKYEMVPPRKWQSAMSCLSGGDKNVTKRKAQELFPEVRITHAIADGLLLAEYARRYGAWAMTKED